MKRSSFKGRFWQKEHFIKKCHSRVFLSGIFHVLSCNHKEKTICIHDRYIEDPRLQASGMTPYFRTVPGFTLIELLVVVLIIGILAAVAVPQYQKAVERTKSAEAVTMLKAVYQSAKEYYLANGEWPTTFAELSVSPNWTGNTKWYTASDIKAAVSNDTWSLQISNDNNFQGIGIGKISGKYKGGGFIIWNKYSSVIRLRHKLLCAEKKAEISTAGNYCQKIMNSKKLLQTGDTLRYYEM